MPLREAPRLGAVDETVPFHEVWVEDEAVACAEAVRTGTWQGNGPIGREIEANLRQLLGVPHALLMSSCTAALEAALATLEVAGGEVILPSFGFPSTAAAVVRSGAQPVFADIEPTGLTLDPEAVARAITPRTRAVLHVDYGGFPGTVEAIRQITARDGLPLIEDAAEALGSRCESRPLGGWGDVGCISFHATKLITCGEGGLFVTDDDRPAEAAVAYREYGTNRSAFLRGRVDQYEWIGPGSSALLAEPLAAMLRAQLQRLPQILERRREIARRYHEGFAALVAAGSVQVPAVEPGVEPNWSLYYVLLRDQETAEALRSSLARQRIDARPHFVPLHASAYARHRGFVRGALPVTDSVAGRLLRLPIYPTLSDAQQARVIEAVGGCLGAETLRGSAW